MLFKVLSLVLLVNTVNGFQFALNKNTMNRKYQKKIKLLICALARMMTKD